MSKRTNAGRRRTTVELGVDVENMLAMIRAHGQLRERLGYFGRTSDSFLLRWAVCCWFRQLFPDHPLGCISCYQVGDQNASGQQRRSRRRDR
jgi:hypothetical protein